MAGNYRSSGSTVASRIASIYNTKNVKDKKTIKIKRNTELKPIKEKVVTEPKRKTIPLQPVAKNKQNDKKNVPNVKVTSSIVKGNKSIMYSKSKKNNKVSTNDIKRSVKKKVEIKPRQVNRRNKF